MQRRRVLNLLTVAAVALVARPARSAARPADGRPLRFYVAGARFHDVDPSTLKPGAAVELRRGRFAGEVCYAVHDSACRRLGYVPRRLVSGLAGGGVGAASLVSVRPHAVPWKRLLVVVEPLWSPSARAGGR